MDSNHKGLGLTRDGETWYFRGGVVSDESARQIIEFESSAAQLKAAATDADQKEG